VALVFGAVFVAAGLIVLAGGELTEEGRALVPAGLIALGVALLVHVGRRGRPPAPAGPVALPPPRVDDRDLDDLFAPVDDALADWDRANAGGGTVDADAPATDATHATDATDATDATGVTNATRVDITEVEPPGPDATPTDPEADVSATDPDVDVTPADPDVDVTEVVDPTQRYPRREPD
jgi:hypothetical protein